MPVDFQDLKVLKVDGHLLKERLPIMKSHWFGRVFKVFSVGAVMGAILATWIGPKIIPWYYEPGASMGVTCKPSVQGALFRLQWTQIIGVLVGGIIAWIFFYGIFGHKDEPRDPLLE